MLSRVLARTPIRRPVQFNFQQLRFVTTGYEEATNTLRYDMKTAMMRKEGERKNTIKYLLTAIKNKELETDPSKYNEFVLFEIYRSILNQMKTSKEEYLQNGRTELAEKEQRSIDLVKQYSDFLNVTSEEEILKRVTSEIEELERKSETPVTQKDAFKKINWVDLSIHWNASIDTVKATVGKVLKERAAKK